MKRKIESMNQLLAEKVRLQQKILQSEKEIQIGFSQLSESLQPVNLVKHSLKSVFGSGNSENPIWLVALKSGIAWFLRFQRIENENSEKKKSKSGFGGFLASLLEVL